MNETQLVTSKETRTSVMMGHGRDQLQGDRAVLGGCSAGGGTDGGRPARGVQHPPHMHESSS